MRHWDLKRREDVWIDENDTPLEDQPKKVLLELIYDLQSAVSQKTAIIETMAAQQDKFLSVLRADQKTKGK